MNNNLQIFNLLKNEYFHQISDEDRDIFKAKITESYYRQNTKDDLLFELNKQKIDLKKIEHIISTESINNPKLKKLKIISKIINPFVSVLSPFLILGILVIFKPLMSINLKYIMATILMFISPLVFLGMLKISFSLQDKRSNMEKYDDIKSLFFEKILKNKDIKNNVLIELKEKIDNISQITNGNKKAISILEEYYYEIEEALLEKDMTSFSYIESNLILFLEAEENYKELYKENNQEKKETLLELHY